MCHRNSKNEVSQESVRGPLLARPGRPQPKGLKTAGAAGQRTQRGRQEKAAETLHRKDGGLPRESEA